MTPLPRIILAAMLVWLTAVTRPASAQERDMPEERTLLREAFDNLDRWHLEGQHDAVTITQAGVLRLACDGSRQGGVGAMAFCKLDFPDRIAIEYDLVVETHNGLLITFVAMQGRHGEDAITGVPPRSGVFSDYVGDDATTRSYHVSVCRYNDKGEHTGVSNWRRNPGLHLMATGDDLCTQTDRTYRVRITKDGPICRIEVDGQLGAEFVDPQELADPMPTSGKIGFRAIGAKAFFRISNLKVTTLPPAAQ